MGNKANLLRRAAMSEDQFGTGVVRSTDQAGRVGVSTNATAQWSDCVSLQFMFENEAPHWRVMAFSPARARIIANHLLRVAKAHEKSAGKHCIDHYEATNDRD